MGMFPCVLCFVVFVASQFLNGLARQKTMNCLFTTKMIFPKSIKSRISGSEVLFCACGTCLFLITPRVVRSLCLALLTEQKTIYRKVGLTLGYEKRIFGLCFIWVCLCLWTPPPPKKSGALDHQKRCALKITHTHIQRTLTENRTLHIKESQHHNVKNQHVRI